MTHYTQETAVRVRKSYGRGLAKGDVIGCFYEVLRDADPAMRARFAHADRNQQKRLLRLGITYLVQQASSRVSGTSTPDHYPPIPAGHALHLPPSLYPVFVASWLRTIAAFDGAFDHHLRQDWEAVLAPGLTSMQAESIN